ncbi:glycosyltransferase family 39 protein [Novosphingobium album (ex Hu et al. 2023)]|uniref:Glycosyltransferase family 39 protein n=1 Tax=Novosphingobium album (ex Hu et al. 2023) TaxID=2930093 RepID=A0ABT0AX11_9SPHN|nr:glycosyltransferase family 39 protein [Novosphingobium album (ex Hu et al. 2023)]MCJ2177368.1 glycosyltransferase family 39 protein [Novosphingobium album (ex Hu et al. 2023)]
MALPSTSAETSKGVSPLPAALLIAAVVLLVRTGTFLTEHIDSDEWAYMLMGADVAKGHLPFVHQFDLKPPMVFLLFGAVIAMFGKSLLAIRAIGAMSVFIASFFVFLIARRAVGGWPALAGALMTVALCSGVIGLDTSSELPAIAFLMPAVWLLIRNDAIGVRDAAGCGLLASLAVLTRTNLAVVALAFGLLLVVLSAQRSRRCTRLGWLAYGAAGLVPPAVLATIYALAGEFGTFRLAMIDVPLAYSGQLSALEVLRLHATQYYYTAQIAPFTYVPMTLLAATGLVASTRPVHRDSPGAARVVLLAWTGLLAVGASLLIGGAAYPHYWLQAMPFLGIFATFAIAAAARMKKMSAIALSLAGALAAVPPVTALAMGIPRTLALLRHPESIDHSIRDAADWIRERGGAHVQVWALHMHLVLYYLDASPLSRAGVYPSNLARKAIIGTLSRQGYVGTDETGRIMASIPRFVVTDRMERGRKWVREAGKDIDGWLAAHYQLAARFGDVEIYERI